MEIHFPFQGLQLLNGESYKSTESQMNSTESQKNSTESQKNSKESQNNSIGSH